MPKGELRPQDWEETVSCLGCHGGIGATTDSSFAFPRKIRSGEAGWDYGVGFSWLPEPIRADGLHDYTTYLMQNHSGDEFRQNQELIGRFFDAKGNGGMTQGSVCARTAAMPSTPLLPGHWS